jgi:hypothetical protein
MVTSGRRYRRPADTGTGVILHRRHDSALTPIDYTLSVVRSRSVPNQRSKQLTAGAHSAGWSAFSRKRARQPRWSGDMHRNFRTGRPTSSRLRAGPRRRVWARSSITSCTVPRRRQKPLPFGGGYRQLLGDGTERDVGMSDNRDQIHPSRRQFLAGVGGGRCRAGGHVDGRQAEPFGADGQGSRLGAPVGPRRSGSCCCAQLVGRMLPSLPPYAEATPSPGRGAGGDPGCGVVLLRLLARQVGKAA